jgi:hypothetical protein
MVWKQKIRKLVYYKDLLLLMHTFFASLKVSLSPDDFLLSLAIPYNRRKSEEKEKIVKYVHFCLFLRKYLGFKDTCLTSSLLLCSLLRQHGIDAQMNFSAKKDREEMAGHCWVSVGNERIASDYTLIFKYP